MTSTPDRRAVIEAIRAEFESSRGSRIWTDFVNALRLVSQVVFTRSSGFVLEFIQNAEDAGQGLSGKGEVSICVNKYSPPERGSPRASHGRSQSYPCRALPFLEVDQRHLDHG